MTQQAGRAENSPLLFLYRILQGALIGGGAILPGVSGGVLAVVFGIYQPMMAFLSRPVSTFKKQWRLFVPVILGVGLGFWGFAKLMGWMFRDDSPIPLALFAGLILGTLPQLYRNSRRSGEGQPLNAREKRANHLSILIAFALLISLLLFLQTGTRLDYTRFTELQSNEIRLEYSLRGSERQASEALGSLSLRLAMGDPAGAHGALTLIPCEAQGALLPGAVEGDGSPSPAISLSLPQDLPRDTVYTLYLEDEPAGQFEEAESGARTLRLQFDKSHLDWRPTLFWSLVSGVIWGFSLVVPGLSSSALLIFMGVYKYLMNSVGALDFGVIIPLLSGIALVAFLFARMVDRLFEKHYSLASGAVVGLVTASTLVIIPRQFSSLPEALLCLLMGALGFVAAFFLGKWGETVKPG